MAGSNWPGTVLPSDALSATVSSSPLARAAETGLAGETPLALAAGTTSSEDGSGGDVVWAAFLPAGVRVDELVHAAAATSASRLAPTPTRRHTTTRRITVPSPEHDARCAPRRTPPRLVCAVVTCH